VGNKLRKAFRTTKVSIKSFPEEVRANLEQLYMNLEAAKTDAVQAEREAGIAVSNGQVKRSKAQVAELELMQAAAVHNKQIAGDRSWLAYINKDGDVIFEGVTDRVQRNAARANLEMKGKQLSEGSDADDDMYEDADEDEEG
jgi:hypothetical protein